MKSALAAALALSVGGASPAFARPQIRSSDPARLRVEPTASGYTRVMLSGRDLTRSDTTGYNVQEHIHVFVRGTRGSGCFQPVPLDGWGSRIAVKLDRATWLRAPDRLEFKISLKGVGDSNAFPVDVYPLLGKPRLTSLQVTRVPVLSKIRSRNDRLVRAVAANLTSDTQVLVGGRVAVIAMMPAGSNVVDFWIPETIQSRAGRYPVILRNPLGTSNTLTLKVGKVNLTRVFVRSSLPSSSVRAGLRSLPGRAAPMWGLARHLATPRESVSPRGVKSVHVHHTWHPHVAKVPAPTGLQHLPLLNGWWSRWRRPRPKQAPRAVSPPAKGLPRP